MTVSELASSLLRLERDGFGNKRVYFECGCDIEEPTTTPITDIEVEKTGVIFKFSN